MSLDTHKPANYRRGWKGEDAAAHLKPDWTITVCDACMTSTCWQGEFYCEKAKSAGTKEITVAEARERNQENPTWWLKDEGIKQRLASETAVCEVCGGGWGGYTACMACNGTGKAVEAADAKVRRYAVESSRLEEVSHWHAGNGSLCFVILATEHKAEIARMQSELTTLRAKLAEAERDSERLLWFANDIGVDQIGDIDLHERSCEYSDGCEPKPEDFLRAVRDAIDAALQQGSTKGE